MADQIILTTFSSPSNTIDTGTEATGKIIDTENVKLDGESKTSSDTSQPNKLTTFSSPTNKETTWKVIDTENVKLDGESKTSTDTSHPQLDPTLDTKLTTDSLQTNVKDTGTESTQKTTDPQTVKLDGESSNNKGGSQPKSDAVNEVTICNSLPRETAVNGPKLSTFGHPISTNLEKQERIPDAETKEQIQTTGSTAEVCGTLDQAGNAEITTRFSDVTTTKTDLDQLLKSDELTTTEADTKDELGAKPTDETNPDEHKEIVVLRDESVHSNSLASGMNPPSYSKDVGVIFVDPKERRTKRARRVVLCAMAIATASLIVVAVGMVLLSAFTDLRKILALSDGTKTTNAIITGEAEINKLAFSDHYTDKTSEEFKRLERQFVKSVDNFFEGSNHRDIYTKTRVTQVRAGSVFVSFVVLLKPLSKPTSATDERVYTNVLTYMGSLKSITINSTDYDVRIVKLHLSAGSISKTKHGPDITARTPPHLYSTDGPQSLQPTTRPHMSSGSPRSSISSPNTPHPTRSTAGGMGTRPITVPQSDVTDVNGAGTMTQLSTSQQSTTITYTSPEMPQSGQPTSQPPTTIASTSQEMLSSGDRTTVIQGVENSTDTVTRLLLTTTAPSASTAAENRKKRSTGSQLTASLTYVTSGSQGVDKKTSMARQLSTSSVPTTLPNEPSTPRYATNRSTDSQPTASQISVTSSSQAASNRILTTPQLHPSQQSTTLSRKSTAFRRSTTWVQGTRLARSTSTPTSTNQAVDKHTNQPSTTRSLTSTGVQLPIYSSSSRRSTVRQTLGPSTSETDANWAINTSKQSPTTTLNIAFTSPLGSTIKDQTSMSQATTQTQGSTVRQKASTLISDSPSITKSYTLQPAAQIPTRTDEFLEGCFPNPLEVCVSRSWSQNFTKMPNAFSFGNNTSEIRRLFATMTFPVDLPRADSTLKVLCSILTPPCDGEQLGHPLPCRSACLDAVRSLDDSAETRKLGALCNESLPESESEDICFGSPSGNNNYDSSSAGMCHSGFCLNGGSCFVMYNRAFCRCSTEFGGTRCQIDPCSPNPCQNGATCKGHTDFVKSYACGCSEGFRGKHCELNVHDPDVTVSQRQGPTQMTPINVTECRDLLPYNVTSADTTGVPDWRLVEPLSSCSDHAPLLFCTMAHPEFQPSNEGALQHPMRTPCRSLCETVFSECRLLFAILERDFPEADICQWFGTEPTDVDNFCSMTQ